MFRKTIFAERAVRVLLQPLLLVVVGGGVSQASLIGTYDVYYMANAAGCINDPNPFQCSYLSGPIQINAAPGDYRLDILIQLDPTNPTGGLRIWSGDALGGVQFNPEVDPNFHHSSGQIYLYYHDWFPYDNGATRGTRVSLFSVDTPEAGTFLLMGIGLGVVLLRRRCLGE